MKKLVILVIIIAICLTACDNIEESDPELISRVNNTNGQLTIYGLENYDGKYVSISAGNDGKPAIRGYANRIIYSGVGGTNSVTLGRIIYGSVTLKVWRINDPQSNILFDNYNDTDTRLIHIQIYDNETGSSGVYASGIGNPVGGPYGTGYNGEMDVPFYNGVGSCV
jgi:hypothetical protein